MNTFMTNKDKYIPQVKIINQSYLSGDHFRASEQYLHKHKI